MMRLVAGVDWNRYHRRTYVVSSGDTHSETKALELEKNIGSGTVSSVSPFEDCGLTIVQFEILRIPRARRVHQSYLTSPFTTLYSLVYCLWYITLRPLLSMGGQKVFADLILLNGPGSCVPIVLSAFLPKVHPTYISASSKTDVD
jgi:beta-1,4-N-acetylglucosaminyltransferase